MESNFMFLKDKYRELSECGMFAELYLYSDPNTCIFKLGQFAEILVNYMMAYDNITVPYNNTHANRIKELKRKGLLTQEIDDILYRLRKRRNEATHSLYSSEAEAEILMEHTHTLGIWFMQVYGEIQYDIQEYEKPPKRLYEITKLSEENIELEKRITNLESEYIAIAKKYDKRLALERLEKAKRLSRNMERSEAETRDLIDEQLRKAGWIADTNVVRYSKGVRPEKGKNLAIAEWPTNSILPNRRGTGRGAVDYALFVGLKMVAVVEAKKFKKDIPSVIDSQCKDYASAIREKDHGYIIDRYDEYYTPFIFATNGRKFYNELPNQSGIWFLDVRRNTNSAKPLKNWLSPDDIQELLEMDIIKANSKLEDDTNSYLLDENGLNLRDYQYNAVKAVEKAVLKGEEKILLSMATGTGKTRVALGMIYKFLKAARFNRILFLVDRTSLGEQAKDKFAEVNLEELQNLIDIYGLTDLRAKELDMTDKVHIVTVQSLVRKLLYNDNSVSNATLTPGNYDCIIVDEAHRGYTLEQEMDEDDILYRNQSDFQSKYRQVIEYFDAVKIALTATPALHTIEIFSKPVFNYSYRKAVIDGYLIDHEPPYIVDTEFNTEGIKYEKGETLAIIDPLTKEITNSDALEDEIKFDVDKFNKKIITPKFNETVLRKVATMIDPEGDEKTLIFAVDDKHADEIVTMLRNIYDEIGGVDHRSIRKITGKAEDGNSEKVQKLIRKYKNDDFPNIAVTVDLLTTGIDVPEITTLVFMRRVKSRILFEQMIGRATRLCPGINKTHFNIIDAVKVYESLEPVTNMKPVTTKATLAMEALIDELDVVSEEKIHVNIDQILAKAHRKKNLLTDAQKKELKCVNDGKSIDEILRDIKNSGGNSVEKVKSYRDTLMFLEQLENNARGKKIFSDKEDTFKEIKRGYGDWAKPEDYLESFEAFINENRDIIPALNVVCTKPSSLTGKELKSLMVELDKHKFNKTNLQVAFKDAKNVDIVADIISYIRAVALDIPLISQEARIKHAFEKVIKNHDFNKMQMKWLKRIEATLLTETVLDMNMLNSGVFKSKGGGVLRLDKLFENKLESIVNEINTELYEGDMNEYIRDSI